MNLCLIHRFSNSVSHVMGQWHNFQDSMIVLMVEDAIMVQMEGQNKKLAGCKI